MQPLGQPHPSHRRPANVDRFWFGAAYYPEHWDAATREHDAGRMAAAGFNLARLAEFAWDRLEPREGQYDFGLFDETIERLAARGIRTMLCTPTAAPPRWLTQEHRDVLRVDESGRVMQHGSRQHACHASPVFREHSRRITRVMAEHYRDNPHVVGWQTDNEINCHFSECHCANCEKAFHDYLRRKFDGDIEELNLTWGTAFWAQTYDRFSDISTPRCDRPAYENPAQRLDYYRFIHDTVARFQHEQVAILREVQPRWFVTHNGVMRHVDYRGLFGQDLDFLGYDVYPFFVNDPEIRWHAQANGLDRVRSMTGNFMVPEHQSGGGGQRPYFHDQPEPGELRLMTYASIARGADSLLYFRWRTCRFGAEEYWLGILDHDNVPRRRYEEVAAIGAELARVGPAVLGTSVRVDCATAGGDVEMTDAHATYNLGLPAPDSIAELVHKTLLVRGYAVGYVHPSDDLSGLKLYVVPHWTNFDPHWVPNLRHFVEGGGTLVIGARTGTRDLNNNVVPDTLPGCLRDLAGTSVLEYGRRNNPRVRPMQFVTGAGATPAAHWYETLAAPDGTRVLATWQGRHLDGQAAATVRRLGRGHVVYVGTYLGEDVLAALLPDLLALSGLERLYGPAPAGVEVVVREGQGRRLWFFLNHTDGDVAFPAPAGEDLLTGAATGTAPLHLGRHGAAVVAGKP